MTDLDSLSCLVEQMRDAVTAARLTGAELWRRAVFDGSASFEDARAADARCSGLEAELTRAEKRLAEARSTAVLVAAIQAGVREALRQGPLPSTKLAEVCGARRADVHAAVRSMVVGREIVRCRDGYALAAT